MSIMNYSTPVAIFRRCFLDNVLLVNVQDRNCLLYTGTLSTIPFHHPTLVTSGCVPDAPDLATTQAHGSQAAGYLRPRPVQAQTYSKWAEAPPVTRTDEMMASCDTPGFSGVRDVT